MASEDRSPRTKLGHLWAQFKYLPRALHLVWVPARGWTLAWVVLLVILGVLPAVTIYLSRSFIDSLVMTCEARWSFVLPSAGWSSSPKTRRLPTFAWSLLISRP